MENNAWVDFVSRYHGDAGFAKEVDKDPATTMKKAGISVPAGKIIKLVKNTKDILHYVMPSSPISSISEDELQGVAAGTCSCHGGCATCNG